MKKNVFMPLGLTILSLLGSGCGVEPSTATQTRVVYVPRHPMLYPTIESEMETALYRHEQVVDAGHGVIYQAEVVDEEEDGGEDEAVDED